jgi:hypothetical protein
MMAVLIVVSIKPLQFTLNFITAAFRVDRSEGEAAAPMIRSVNVKPSVLRVYEEYRPGLIEGYLIKKAVYADDRRFLETLPGGIDASKLKETYRDNIYVGRLLGTLEQREEDGRWQHLDSVSLEILADKTMNPVTDEILKKISPRLDAAFIKNLADYTYWRGNGQLSRSITALIGDVKQEDGRPVFLARHVPGRSTAAAMVSLAAYLEETHRLTVEDIGSNLLENPGFDNPGINGDKAEHWYFSRMAGKKKFSRGSFYMDRDTVGTGGGNWVMRIMGFFISRDSGKSRPRAGVRSRPQMVAENGYYVFGFDIYQVTGKERPSFWLAQGMHEKRLRPEPGKWRQVIFILNNSKNKYTYLNPLVRMWGTGTILVDNMVLAKITAPDFAIPEEGDAFSGKTWVQ